MDLSVFEPYRIDCGNCCGLCCVALHFAKTDGFPKDKEAGRACENLQPDYKCKVYAGLLDQGLKGCMRYDCFGAGQYVTRRIKFSPDWQTISPEKAAVIFSAYSVVLRVHQTLWYLSQCLTLRLPLAEIKQANALIAEGRRFIDESAEVLAVLDTQPFIDKSNQYLKHICTSCKLNAPNAFKVRSSNYMGKNLKQKNLAGADFSMSLLIAANLEQAKLEGANFLGADLRDTNICGTDLSQCLFLTQMQINTAKGDSLTILPPYLHRPKLWDCN